MKTLLPLLFTICLIACSKTTEKKDPLVASIDSVMQSVVDTARFNGNVLVARNGEVIYKKSFGKANFYTNEPLNDSMLFDLASVSKSMTAMAIMQLKEKGKLSYDDDIKKYLPELKYEGMTIRHFLQHTSGIADYEEAMMKAQWDANKIAFNDDVLKVLAEQKSPILFKPNDKFVYSNTAYALLAIIVERVSGMPFKEYMKQNVFTPAGMNSTVVFNMRRSGETLPNYAYGFVWSDSLKRYELPDSLKEFFFVYPLDGITGDGAVNSNLDELFKWNEALYSDKLVSKATLEEAFVSGKLNNDSIYNYGFGWFIDRDSTLGKFVRHTGSWPGYRNLVMRFLDTKDCVIILTNNENPQARSTVGKEIRRRLAKFSTHSVK